MRILYFITELDVAGAQRALYHLACGMARRGNTVEVICLLGRGEVVRWLEAAGIRVHSINAEKIWLPGSIARIARIVAQFQPDILHTFLFHSNIVGRVVGRLVPVGAIICSVRNEDRKRLWRLQIDGWTQSFMDAETCVSRSTLKLTRDRGRIAAHKLVAIRNAVDLTRFELRRGAIRAELGIASEQPVVVAVGRLIAGKGFEHLMSAVAMPLRIVEKALLVIVGQGPLEEALHAQLVRLGLERRVRFLGFRSDVAQILVDADLMVHASESEGMPNVVLEAMAAHCAVIATDVGGCPELVDHGVTGLLVPAGDLQALEAAILLCLNQPEWMAELGKAGRAKAEKELGVEQMVDRNQELYERILSGRLG